MRDIESNLERWRQSLCPKIEVGGLISRSSVAHKWKAPHRSIVLRELLFWRLHDLLVQVVALAKGNHGLGARILLRSAVETLALLIFLNQKTEAVLSKKEPFSAFNEATSKLLLGSKDKSTSWEAVNILNVLEKCKQHHPGLVQLHVILCECTHPNYDGVAGGYSRVDHENFTTLFENSWATRWGAEQEKAIRLCMAAFESEYNDVWPELFGRLEVWLVENDAELEASKNGR